MSKMASEKRLIDADAVLEVLQDLREHDGFPEYRTAIRAVERLPTVDAVEVVHGRWEARRMTDIKMVEVKCSACGWLDTDTYDAIVDYSAFNYCPNCGAKMDGGNT